MTGKKELVARFAACSGVTRLVETFNGPPNLLILNYHRIGNAEQTRYDSGTFSCTSAQFDWQIRHLSRRHRIVDLPEALRIVHGESRPTRPSILLTFDDGYLDNYQEAFPILLQHKVSATFFLPTAFVGSGFVPWWDVIAYIVKTSAHKIITLTYPATAVFDLTPPSRERSIRAILKLYKQAANSDAERFLCELEAACASQRPPAEVERSFLNWDEARTMEAGGMCFGSHTHTHEILSKLPYARQVEELCTSRAILERELGHNVDTLAYPVGARASFSADTFKALAEAQYLTAFSFDSGINRPGRIEPYDVLRCSVDDESQRVFRLRNALRGATGNDFF